MITNNAGAACLDTATFAHNLTLITVTRNTKQKKFPLITQLLHDFFAPSFPGLVIVSQLSSAIEVSKSICQSA